MLGAQLPLASALPFVVLLAAIALLPLVAPRWWHPNRNKAIVAVVVSLPVLWQLGITLGEPGRAILAEKLHEYLGFIVVIGALFIITGGIHIQGSFAGTPLVNTGLLGIGAVLANLLGTTGASVLLIRPLLRANKARKRIAHIVIFFIFIAANCGGLLTTILGAGLAAARGAPWSAGSRELAIVMIAAIAYMGTPRENRERNAFTFGPIIEVAILFAAIFITMAPVLEMLNIWARGPG